jgi:dTMP kinase
MIIAFEGIDGSGKDSVIQKITQRCSNRGITSKCFYIVGGSELADRIRDIMFYSDVEMSEASRELFYTIIRMEVFKEADRYHKENPDHLLIFNRTIVSSLVYQALVSQDKNAVRRISDLYSASVNFNSSGSAATDIDTMFYLKISLETSIKRDLIGCDYDNNNHNKLELASRFYDKIFNRTLGQLYHHCIGSNQELETFLKNVDMKTINAEQELEDVVNDVENYLNEKYPLYFRK